MHTLKLIVIGLIAAGLLFLMMAYFPGTKTEEGPTFIVTESPTDFVETGTLTFATTTAQSLLFLDYTNGTGTTTIPLYIDELSICSSATGAIPCVAMSISFDVAFGGKKAVVEGIQREDGILLRKLYILSENETARLPELGSIFISWPQAVSLIEGCSVEMIMQTHTLDVYLTLENDVKVRTIQPVIDEVFGIYNGSISKCGNIPVATE